MTHTQAEQWQAARDNPPSSDSRGYVDMFKYVRGMQDVYPHDTNRTGDLVRVLAWAADQYAWQRRTGLAFDKHTAVALESVERAVAEARKRYPGNPPADYLGRI